MSIYPILSYLPKGLSSAHYVVLQVGPVLEAFGYGRIIFGSSHSSASSASSNASDWYEIARESFAELGVEQEAIDAVFFLNAKKVYGAS